jgi:hypothetical protein
MHCIVMTTSYGERRGKHRTTFATDGLETTRTR